MKEALKLLTRRGNLKSVEGSVRGICGGIAPFSCNNNTISSTLGKKTAFVALGLKKKKKQWCEASDGSVIIHNEQKKSSIGAQGKGVHREMLKE